MSIEQSRRTMDRYFEAMSRGQFQQFFIQTVWWLSSRTICTDAFGRDP